ncbi:MAG: DUF3551 domain-containing protein [Xanthobacteraceae bacterium]
MRRGIIFAAALLAVPASAALATPTATAAPSSQSEQYCGFDPKPGSLVECGYSSRESCETAIGKGAMCFVNPYVVLNTRRPMPVSRHSEG